MERTLALRLSLADYNLSLALHTLGLQRRVGGWVTPPPSPKAAASPSPCGDGNGTGTGTGTDTGNGNGTNGGIVGTGVVAEAKVVDGMAVVEGEGEGEGHEQ